MLLNPNFRDCGIQQGEAAHWALRTFCQRQSLAGFGPSPERATEDFERWLKHASAFEQGDLAMAMFDPLAEGLEDFEEAWNDGPFLTELSGGIAEPCVFAGSTSENMEAGWLSSGLVCLWAEVSSEPGVFGPAADELFEDWYPSVVPLWTVARFDSPSKNFDDFAGSWPAMHSL